MIRIEPIVNFAQWIIRCVENNHFGFFIKQSFKFSIIKNIISRADIVTASFVLCIQIENKSIHRTNGAIFVLLFTNRSGM